MKEAVQKKTSIFAAEIEREEDGRWIVEITNVPGAMAYGSTKAEALRRAYAVALRTLADSVEQGRKPSLISFLSGYGMASR